MSKEKTAKMPAAEYAKLKQEIEEHGISKTRLAEHLDLSRQTLYNWLGAETLPLDNAKRLEAAKDAILEEERNELDRQRHQISDAMAESLHALIELLKDDARSMKALENMAWALYRARVPQCPEFYDFDPPNWEVLLYRAASDKPINNVFDDYPFTPEKWQSAIDAAKDNRSKHIEAEALHEQAAIIANDRYIEGEAGAGFNRWASWEQFREDLEKDLALNRSIFWCLSWPEDKKDSEEYYKVAEYTDRKEAEMQG